MGEAGILSPSCGLRARNSPGGKRYRHGSSSLTRLATLSPVEILGKLHREAPVQDACGRQKTLTPERRLAQTQPLQARMGRLRLFALSNHEREQKGEVAIESS